MDKEKIIKEMEAILEQEQIKIANTVEEFAKLQKVGITRCNAEALYNANCQVIPEGAVVLTREEYDDLQSEYDKVYKQAEADIHGNIANGGTSCHWCDDITKRAKAKEILTKMKKRIDDIYDSQYQRVTFEIIDELAEENGVEVE